MVLVDVVNGADVGVVQVASGSSLAQEALAGMLIFSGLIEQELESDEAVQAGVLGFVEDIHAPATQFLHNAVEGHRLANHAKSDLPCAHLTVAYPASQGGLRGWDSRGRKSVVVGISDNKRRDGRLLYVGRQMARDPGIPRPAVLCKDRSPVRR